MYKAEGFFLHVLSLVEASTLHLQSPELGLKVAAHETFYLVESQIPSLFSGEIYEGTS